MVKYCPNCGNELNDSAVFCSKCGHKIKNKSSLNIIPTKKEQKLDDRKKKIAIVSVTAIIIIIIVCLAVFAVNGSDNSLNPFGEDNNPDNILTIDDLQLNMTGYTYELESNTSTSTSGVNGTSLTYQVTGNDDSFSIVVMIMDDTYGVGSAGESNTSLSGDLNTVATNRYINGKYYWIQIVGGNSQHCNQAYLDSIILSKNTTKSETSSADSTGSSDAVSSSSHKMTEEECIAAGLHDTNHDGYCSNCGHYVDISDDADSNTGNSHSKDKHKSSSDSSSSSDDYYWEDDLDDSDYSYDW